MLAGGTSRRMGRDKLLIEIGGKPLIQRVADALSIRCEEVIVVGAGGALSPERVRRITDEREGARGPLAGIEAGLRAAGNPVSFVAAGDMPFLDPALAGHLLGLLAQRGRLVVVPRHGGREHPLCAAYARGVLPHVRSALDEGMLSVRELLKRLDDVEYVDTPELWRFGDPDLMLMNVNSPEDLERARRAGQR